MASEPFNPLVVEKLQYIILLKNHKQTSNDILEVY